MSQLHPDTTGNSSPVDMYLIAPGLQHRLQLFRIQESKRIQMINCSILMKLLCYSI